MSPRTEELIARLARDLRPVEPLAPLYKVSTRLLVATAVVVGLAAAVGIAGGLLLPAAPTRSGYASIAGHLLLAFGALAVALASCVPGRERLERAGYLATAAGAGTAIAIAILLFRSAPPGGLGFVWTADTLVCTLLSTLPALVPAVLLVEFVRSGAPHRPSRTLAFGAVATVAFATLPGQVGCPCPGVLHGVIAHLFAPLTGGAVVFLCSSLLFYRGRVSRAA